MAKKETKKVKKKTTKAGRTIVESNSMGEKVSVGKTLNRYSITLFKFSISYLINTATITYFLFNHPPVTSVLNNNEAIFKHDAEHPYHKRSTLRY